MRHVLEAERERLILWAPVLFGAGCALGLGPLAGVPLWAPVAAALAGGLAAGLGARAAARRGGAWAAVAALALALAAASAGVAAAVGKARAVAAPTLTRPLGAAEADGWVTAVDRGASGPRVTLRLARLGDLAPGETPYSVRLGLGDAPVPPVGAAVRCRGYLAPPPGPIAPGAYDFRRRAWFDRLGAVGRVRGPCAAIDLGPPPDGRLALAMRLAAWRTAAAAAVVRAAPGAGGTILAAVMTGDRSHLSAATNESLQASGLAHLLSVSGLHMSLVAGAVFAALRFGLAAIEPLSLRVPVRKVAAAGAIAAAGAYMVFTGADAPAQRAFIMAAVALGAVLLDRPALTVRALAVAALIVLALEPQAVLEPGFQMSFAATLAIVAAYEALTARAAGGDRPPPGAVRRVALWVGAAALTSLVAGLATLPAALHHFQRLTPYSLPANVAAAPVISFLITPAALTAAVAAPFGLEEAPLRVAAWGMDQVVAIARLAEGAPGGTARGAALAAGPFALLSVGLLWLCLWRGPVRAGGVLLLALGAGVAAATPPPAGWIAAEGRALAARTAGGPALCVVRGAGFDGARLLEEAGFHGADRAAALARAGRDLRGCAIDLGDGRALTLVPDLASLAEECRLAGVIVTHDAPPPALAAACRAQIVTADDLPLGARVLRTSGGLQIHAPRAPPAAWARGA